ncbi:unnamed protein product [marine sediment metagenome]|uniref:Uncharacterized protein n=1 Tax=marine sediment metagenome TaxID=412755 RepID=X1T8M0_9ZZZZ
MVQTKKMNESFFAHLLKEFNVAGELIRARQEEKQGLLNEFDAECKRYFFGKVSEKTLAASVRKTNNELQRLDSEIRKAITRADKNNWQLSTDLKNYKHPKLRRKTVRVFSRVQFPLALVQELQTSALDLIF